MVTLTLEPTALDSRLPSQSAVISRKSDKARERVNRRESDTGSPTRARVRGVWYWWCCNNKEAHRGEWLMRVMDQGWEVGSTIETPFIKMEFPRTSITVWNDCIWMIINWIVTENQMRYKTTKLVLIKQILSRCSSKKVLETCLWPLAKGLSSDE